MSGGMDQFTAISAGDGDAGNGNGTAVNGNGTAVNGNGTAVTSAAPPNGESKKDGTPPDDPGNFLQVCRAGGTFNRI